MLFAGSAQSASEAELQKCAGIKDDLHRLSCFDVLVPTAVTGEENVPTGVPMSVVDYMTDYKALQGTTVSVNGFGLVMGEMTLLYQEQGQFTALTVEISKLSREDRRSLLAGCGAGCDITITGKATEYFGNAALSATTVQLD
jgi:hypothetical protein